MTFCMHLSNVLKGSEAVDRIKRGTVGNQRGYSCYFDDT